MIENARSTKTRLQTISQDDIYIILRFVQICMLVKHHYLLKKSLLEEFVWLMYCKSIHCIKLQPMQWYTYIHTLYIYICVCVCVGVCVCVLGWKNTRSSEVDLICRNIWWRQTFRFLDLYQGVLFNNLLTLMKIQKSERLTMANISINISTYEIILWRPCIFSSYIFTRLYIDEKTQSSEDDCIYIYIYIIN